MTRNIDDAIYCGVEAVRNAAQRHLSGEDDHLKVKALTAIVQGCQDVMDQREAELKAREVEDDIDREVAGLND